MTPQRRPGRPRRTSRTDLLLVGVAAAAVLAAAALSAILGPGGTAPSDRPGAGGLTPEGRTDGPFGALVAAGPDLWVPRAARAGITADRFPRGLSVRATRQRRGQRPCRHQVLVAARHPPVGRWGLRPGAAEDRHGLLGSPGRRAGRPKKNRYAFTGQASDVTIEYLTIQNFGTRLENRDEGVVNHDQGDGWKIRHNTVRWNGGAGRLHRRRQHRGPQLPPGQRPVRLQRLRTRWRAQRPAAPQRHDAPASAAGHPVAALASLVRLWAVQISAHSCFTFSRPRRRNCRNLVPP